MDFSNREIASGIWLIVLTLWLSQSPKVRDSFGKLLRVLLSLKIVVPLVLMTTYVSFCVWCLYDIGFWKSSFLEETIVWFCLGAFVTFVRHGGSSSPEPILKGILLDNFKLAIVIEFLFDKYTLSLPLELIFLPLVTIVVLGHTVASSYSNFRPAATLLWILQVAIGVAILGYVSVRVFNDLGSIDWVSELREFANTPILAILLCPFVYGFVVFARYELFLLRLRFGAKKTPALIEFARREVVRYAGPNLKRLKHLTDNFALDFSRLAGPEDVTRIISAARMSECR